MDKYENVYRPAYKGRARGIYDEAVENIGGKDNIPNTIPSDEQIYVFFGFASARNGYFTSTKNNSNGDKNND